MQPLKKDRWALGVTIGIILPLIIYGLLLLVLGQYGRVDDLIYVPRPKAPALAAIFANLFPFRYYMVNKKFDRTGRGILLITFIMTVLLFYFFNHGGPWHVTIS